MLTIPSAQWKPHLPEGVLWIKGQMELGEGGYSHYQLIALFGKKCTLTAVRRIFGPYHAELTRSSAAEDYVWKETTFVSGTRFEIGTKPVQRSSARDWDSIWQSAIEGRLLDIPADIRVRCYNVLQRIASDFASPSPMERDISVFWGETGTGKSRRAWDEAGDQAYPKDPRSKFWCGYRGQAHVVLDEFRGGIDIAHLLRWFDRYPVCVEIKGSSTPLCATRIWVTSNLHPDCWYPDVDHTTRNALMRRLKIVFIE